MTGLHAQLRAETAALHERVDDLALFRALLDGSLPPLSLVSWMRGLAIIHTVLGRSLAGCSSPEIAALAERAASKVPLLVADLSVVADETTPSIGPAIERALGCASDILLVDDQPLALLGILYVLDGSQQASAALTQAFARCLGVQPARLSYFGCDESSTREFVDQIPLDASSAARVVAAASACFRAIERIGAAVYPYAAGDLTHHVTAINFEAGDHAIPQDPLEITVALRAGQQAWTNYPYLALRFGERGKRFTRSDCCWLMALTGMPVATVTKNLRWLRSVLASRGRPTVILESYLRSIVQARATELVDRTDGSACYGPFLEQLEAERRSLGDWEAIIESFEVQLRACEGLTVESAARLIASSWLDTQAGITGALTTTRSWFVDPLRFSTGWIETIGQLVTRLDRLPQLRSDPC